MQDHTLPVEVFFHLFQRFLFIISSLVQHLRPLNASVQIFTAKLTWSCWFVCKFIQAYVCTWNSFKTAKKYEGNTQKAGAMGTPTSVFSNLKCIFECNSFKWANSCSQPAQLPARNLHLYKDTRGFHGQGWCEPATASNDSPVLRVQQYAFVFTKWILLYLFQFMHIHLVACKETWEKTYPWLISKGPMKPIPSSIVFSSASRHLKRKKCLYFLMKSFVES